jgi:hypothetical protein
LASKVAVEVFNAFMVKDDWYTTWPDIDRHTIPVDHRSGVIDFKLSATDEDDGEGMVGFALLEGGERVLEVFKSHARSPCG